MSAATQATAPTACEEFSQDDTTNGVCLNSVKGFLGTGDDTVAAMSSQALDQVAFVHGLTNEQLFPLGEKALKDICDDIIVLNEIRNRFRTAGSAGSLLGYANWRDFVGRNSIYSIRTVQRRLNETNGVRSYTVGQGIPCPECGDVFPSKSKLKKHQHKVHGTHTSPPIPPAPMCPICVEHPHQINEFPDDYRKHPEMQVSASNRSQGMALTRLRKIAKGIDCKVGCVNGIFTVKTGDETLEFNKESEVKEFLQSESPTVVEPVGSASISCDFRYYPAMKFHIEFSLLTKDGNELQIGRAEFFLHGLFPMKNTADEPDPSRSEQLTMTQVAMRTRLRQVGMLSPVTEAAIREWAGAVGAISCDAKVQSTVSKPEPYVIQSDTLYSVAGHHACIFGSEIEDHVRDILGDCAWCGKENAEYYSVSSEKLCAKCKEEDRLFIWSEPQNGAHSGEPTGRVWPQYEHIKSQL